MLVLFKTYLDMIALRRGPDAIPSSWLILAMSVAILAGAWTFQVLLIPGLDGNRLWIAFAGYLLALAFYGSVVYLFGFSRRLLQTLSAIIACGSILAVLSLAEFIVFSPILGTDVAGTVSQLIWYWSVPVKGHIVAQAIQQHWFVGITIAVSAYVMRLGVETAFATQV